MKLAGRRMCAYSGSDSSSAEISLEDAVVPESDRLGPEGAGFPCLMATFQHERLYLAALGYATAERCLEEALAYARQREAFGRTIGKLQVIRHMLADMASRTLAAKALTYQVAARLQAGTSRPAEVAAAKNVAADAAISVSHDAVQILGGMGYMRETTVERLSRDARLLSIGGGTREVMNELIARALEP